METFMFRAVKTYAPLDGWKWVPYLHSFPGGTNLFWPNKRFHAKDLAIKYMQVNIGRIRKAYF